jgi:ABC-type polysaccharide/polyol phosphate transport system ATPase subunit
MSDRSIAIAVESVAKDFRLPSEQRHTLKERVVNPRFDRSAKRFHALRDVSFDVERGEFFGIVGRNGSGKSTLLKCLAGIYKIDRGEIRIAGRLSTFIELGVGFNPDLAARDNIILNGIMLGLSPKEAAARVDQVVRFAELEDHIDLKLKNYSSGMQVRLAFSVMTQIEADVLLIDEVLAVGDAAFQAKCFDVFRQLREAGKTIVLVTHDMGTVARFCDRAMLVEDGEIVEIGAPEHIGDRYLSLNFERPAPSTPQPDTDALPAADTPDVSVTRAFAVDEHAQVTSHIRTGAPVLVAVDVKAERDVSAPLVTVELRDELDNVVFSASNMHQLAENPASMTAGTTWRANVWLQTLLAPGKLRIRALLHEVTTGRLLQRTDDLSYLEVTSVEAIHGMTNLPHHVSWEQIDLIEERPVPTLAPVGARPTAVAPLGPTPSL